MNLMSLKVEMEETQKKLLKQEAEKALTNEMFTPNLFGLKIDTDAILLGLQFWADSKIKELDILLLREKVTKEEYDKIYTFLESV